MSPTFTTINRPIAKAITTHVSLIPREGTDENVPPRFSVWCLIQYVDKFALLYFTSAKCY
jgi:hypothetical protein